MSWHSKYIGFGCSRKLLDTQRSSHSAAASGGGCAHRSARCQGVSHYGSWPGAGKTRQTHVDKTSTQRSSASCAVGRAPTPPPVGERGRLRVRTVGDGGGDFGTRQAANERERSVDPPDQPATTGSRRQRPRVGRPAALQVRFGHLAGSGENWDPATYGPTSAATACVGQPW